MKTEKLNEFFEEQGFQVHLTEQDNQQCAEVEMWTDGGVDMIIWLNPFTVKEFKSYVKDFDIDNEIDLLRNGDDYKKAFTIRESVKDITKYHNHLKKVVKLLDKKYVPDEDNILKILKDKYGYGDISPMYFDEFGQTKASSKIKSDEQYAAKLDKLISK
jgi:hypothetical protein